MKPVRVDFARPPGVSLYYRAAVVTVAVITAGLFMVGFHFRKEANRLRAQTESKVMQARAQAAQLASARASSPAQPPPPYAADARAALRQQEFPLNAVLTALESVAMVGVRVTSVDIQTSEATVRVQVEFSDYETLLKYLGELNAGEPVERWSLVSAQTNAGGTAGRPNALLTSSWAAIEVPNRR